MAHGDEQRRGGELGPASTLLDAQVEEITDLLGGGSADEVTFDDATLTIVVGDDVQAALEAVEDEFVTPTHSHGGGSGLTVIEGVLDADISSTTTFNPHPTATLFTAAGLEAATTYSFILNLRATTPADVSAGIFFEFQLTGLTGEYTFFVAGGKFTDGNAKTVADAATGTRWNELSVAASSGTGYVEIRGSVTTVGAGDLVCKVGAFQSASTFKKGSTYRFVKAA